MNNSDSSIKPEENQESENLNKKLDFGDYCVIEQKRYGVENEMFLYKVVSGGIKSNSYRNVPVDACDPTNTQGEIVDIILAIKCGVDETKVERFRLSDVRTKNIFVYD